MTAKWPAFPKVDPLAAEDITDLGNTVLQGDLRSNAWDGGSDLSGGADPDATAGFYIDSSAGAIQAQNLIAKGGSFEGVTVSGTIESGDSLESANFSSGSAGWQINGAGDAEFNDVTVRGTFETGTSGKHVSVSDATPALIEFKDGATVKGDVGFFGSGIRLRSADSNDLFLSAPNEMFISVVTGQKQITVDLGATTHAMAEQGWLLNGGSASSPAYSFFGDSNTGMLQVSADTLGFAVGGTTAMHLSRISSEEYRMTLPTAVGTYISATRIGSTDRLKLEANDFINSGTIHNQTTGSAANQHINSNGDMLRSTSARKYKSRVTYNVDYLADIDVRPAKFYRKDSSRWFYGLIADDLAAQDPLLADYTDDGEVENYDDRELLAIYAAKLNRHDARLKALESA